MPPIILIELSIVFGGVSRPGNIQVPASMGIDIVHLWRRYSDVSPGDPDTSIITRFPTKSHNPDSELTSFCPVLLMPSSRLGSNRQML